jgi:hypothetical protein
MAIGAAQSARPGLGHDCRLRQPHRRSDVRQHAQADAPALEGASFISAYDRSRIRSTFGVSPPAKLDEVAARELAVKQGLEVVLAGSIDRRDSGYEISVKASQLVTGDVVASASGRASDKEQVLETATRLMARVRSVLGDQASESAQLFAMRRLSTSLLGVVSDYAAAGEAQGENTHPALLVRPDCLLQL